MEYRRVGSSGLVVSELSFGAATFGGSGDFFGAWGNTDVDEARRIIDICWTLVSRCSTPPTSTPTAPPKRCSEPPWWAGVTNC